jgi:TP901 family phage tail tape measure protein
MASFVPVGVTATVKNVQKFQKNLGLMNGAIVGISASITTFALDAAVKMTKAVIGIGKASFDAAVEFESSFAGVKKTVETTDEEFAKMEESFRDLAKTVPVDVNTINEIAELGGQLGVVDDKTEDVTGTLTAFAETIAALGVSTNLTTEAAATDLARFANIMGTTAREGDETYERLGSTIVELGNTMATTESDILNFGSRIAGAGNIAGLTEADVFAIGAAMSSVGVQAEAGGTAVQKTLLAMNEAVINGGTQMEIFAGTAGMSTEKFAELWEEDAGAGFQAFVEGLGEMGDDAL